jgi:hypothetical protein
MRIIKSPFGNTARKAIKKTNCIVVVLAAGMTLFNVSASTAATRISPGSAARTCSRHGGVAPLGYATGCQWCGIQTCAQIVCTGTYGTTCSILIVSTGAKKPPKPHPTPKQPPKPVLHHPGPVTTTPVENHPILLEKGSGGSSKH